MSEKIETEKTPISTEKSSMKILVVEDQPKMAQTIKQGLENEGYQADVAETGKVAEDLVSHNEYALIVLDVMLPDQNGIETAKKVRNQGFKGSILMLTALSTTKDKVSGLDAGADDYVTKPFSFEELLARIRALLRRNQAHLNPSLFYGDMELDLIDRKAKRQSQEISLTAKEFSLLEYFMKNPERPLSRAELAEKVWEIRFDSESNVIDVYVNMLRKKVDNPFDKRLINTVVGVGYVLKQTVE